VTDLLKEYRVDRRRSTLFTSPIRRTRHMQAMALMHPMPHTPPKRLRAWRRCGSALSA
jgi:hypothetical protein